MTEPEVSILLPVFNAAPYLRDCLESLSHQTYTDFEIVAVDDGSGDGSLAMLRQHAVLDPRLRVFDRPHAGLIATLNHGLARCRGELVARMDADDVSLPQRLELQVAAMRTAEGPDVVSCLVSHFPDSAIGEGFRIYEEWLNSLVTHGNILRERFIESPLPHPSIVIRRKILESVGGYRDMDWPEDYDLWLRLANRGATFGKVPEALYLWRHHEGRLTRTDPRYSVERFLTCKAHHLVEGPLSGGVATVVWGAGQTGRRISKHLGRFGVNLKAFVDIDPKKVGKTLRALPIYPPDDLGELLAAGEPTVVLAAVSSRGARALIRQHLDSLGLAEGRGYWCVA